MKKHLPAETGRLDAVLETAARAIRESSAASRLVSEKELLRLMNGQQFSSPDNARENEEPTTLISLMIEQYEDLHAISGKECRHYYSSVHMTASYATILLHKQEGPLQLIAETVRDYTRTYRKPVPAGIFAEPPFSLGHHQIKDCLAQMKSAAEYDDIATATTSISTVYLYSTSCLESGHAVMLAEWLDVGQADNP